MYIKYQGWSIVRGIMLKFYNQTNGRYYYMSIERDLFDDYVLNVVRGGISKRIHYNPFVHQDVEKVHGEIARLSRIRLQRGYTLVND